MKKIRLFLFLCSWLFVICVSVHDGLLVLANRGLMAAFERNPAGRILIAWNGGDIWLLLAAKGAGHGVRGGAIAAALLESLATRFRRLFRG